MSMPYQPTSDEVMADSVRAELDYLKDLVEELIRKWPVDAGITLTADEVTPELRRVLAESRQYGIDVFQYRRD